MQALNIKVIQVYQYLYGKFIKLILELPKETIVVTKSKTKLQITTMMTLYKKLVWLVIITVICINC